MSIGGKIKALRKECGWTQEELAKKINVLQQHVNRWETEKVYPSVDAIKKLARLFNVSVDTLIMDEKDIATLNNREKTLLGKIKGFEKLELKEQEMIANLINTLLKSQTKNQELQEVLTK
jgi:transcriptional regulator with XRE-family HTH domain